MEAFIFVASILFLGCVGILIAAHLSYNRSYNRRREDLVIDHQSVQEKILSAMAGTSVHVGPAQTKCEARAGNKYLRRDSYKLLNGSSYRAKKGALYRLKRFGQREKHKKFVESVFNAVRATNQSPRLLALLPPR